jgi:hypothetical protein
LRFYLTKVNTAGIIEKVPRGSWDSKPGER